MAALIWGHEFENREKEFAGSLGDALDKIEELLDDAFWVAQGALDNAKDGKSLKTDFSYRLTKSPGNLA